MVLREKTIQKFKDYLEKEILKNQGREIELSFSQVQRGTGSASGTMKRALENLQAEGWLEIKPGRNSRYGIFRIINSNNEAEEMEENIPLEPVAAYPEESTLDREKSQEEVLLDQEVRLKVQELEKAVEGLRKRARSQEMTIALLQDRMAEIEDKLYKK